jgi:hypothetical protein
MDISWIPLLSMMLMEGPTVKGVAALLGGFAGAATFISGASVVIIAYVLKRRKKS